MYIRSSREKIERHSLNPIVYPIVYADDDSRPRQRQAAARQGADWPQPYYQEELGWGNLGGSGGGGGGEAGALVMALQQKGDACNIRESEQAGR